MDAEVVTVWAQARICGWMGEVPSRAAARVPKEVLGGPSLNAALTCAAVPGSHPGIRDFVKNAICIGWILILLCLGPSGATAGLIRGTIRLATPRVQATPAMSGRPGTPRSQRNPVMDAVIYLESIPEKLEKKLARNSALAHVGQAYGCFVPSPLPIAAGTTVEFENQDRVYHNVFSVSPAKRFDIGKYAPRASHQVRFDRPGVIKLFCDIDPGEIGYIYVTPNHAYAQPDSSGAFELPKLPPGTYRLRVWHPGYKHITRDIEMPRRGDVSLDLRL